MEVYSISEIANRISPVMVKYEIPKAYIFGSYARGEATENSDVDILIAGKEIHGFCRFSNLLQDITEAVGKDVDLLQEYTLDAYDDAEAKELKHSILQDRRQIYG